MSEEQTAEVPGAADEQRAQPDMQDLQNSDHDSDILSDNEIDQQEPAPEPEQGTGLGGVMNTLIDAIQKQDDEEKVKPSEADVTEEEETAEKERTVPEEGAEMAVVMNTLIDTIEKQDEEEEAKPCESEITEEEETLDKERAMPEEGTEISAIMNTMMDAIEKQEESGNTTELEIQSTTELNEEATSQMDASCQTEPISASDSFMMTQLKDPRVTESRERSRSREPSEVDEKQVIRVVNALNCGCSQSRKMDLSLSRASPKRKRRDQGMTPNWLSTGKGRRQTSESSQRPQSSQSEKAATTPLQRKPVSAEWKGQTQPKRGNRKPAVLKPVHKAPQKRAQEITAQQEKRVEEEEQEEKIPPVLDEMVRGRSVGAEDEEKIVFSNEPDSEQPGEQSEHSTTRTEVEADADEDQIDKILRYELPPPDEQNDVMKYIKTKELTAIIDEEYISARRVQEAEEILMTRPMTSREVDDHYMSGQARLSRARDIYEQKIADWQQRMDEFEAKSNDTMENLKASQEEELQKFEEHWENDRTIMPYTKPSVSLLAIRSHQKVCALTRDFEAALDAQNIADGRQVDEEITAEQRAVTAMKIAHRQLLDKHEQQRACAAKHAERLRLRLEAQRNQELSESVKAIQNIENSLNEPYVARARVNSQTRTLVKSREYQSMPVTPRTRQSLVDYKAQNNQGKLRLNGVSVTQCLHPQPKKSRPFTPGKTKRFGAYR